MPVPRGKMLESAVRMISAMADRGGLSLVYIGKEYPQVQDTLLMEDKISPGGTNYELDWYNHSKVENVIKILKEEKLFMEVERAPFDILFAEMDAFVIHGGLGTTVDALRVHKPIAVSGVLLMDQRFWGQVCADKGVGPPPVHIDELAETCVDFVHKAFEEDSEWLRSAQESEWGEEGSDGVDENVNAFSRLFEEGRLKAVSTGDKGQKGDYSRMLGLFSDRSLMRVGATTSQDRVSIVEEVVVDDEEVFFDAEEFTVPEETDMTMMNYIHHLRESEDEDMARSTTHPHAWTPLSYSGFKHISGSLPVFSKDDLELLSSSLQNTIARDGPRSCSPDQLARTQTSPT